MLVVISDLHLSDGTAGDHNLKPEAYTKVFKKDIIKLIEDHKPKEVELLLLGDIFDLLRSTKWFEYPENNRFDVKDRPWGVNGMRDMDYYLNTGSVISLNSPTEKKCNEILDAIYKKNKKTIKFFRIFIKLLKRKCKDIKTAKVTYIPGNHDRMINLYPSLAIKVRKMLGTKNGNPNNPWFDYVYTNSQFNVYARHGHEHDPYNFGETENGSYARKSQIKISIGDILTTELAVRIPWEVRVLERGNNDPVEKQVLQDLAKQLEDLDNLRPLSAVIGWIYYKIKYHKGVAEEALNIAYDNMVQALLSVDSLGRVTGWSYGHARLIKFLGSRLVRTPAKKLATWVSAKLQLRLIMKNSVSGDSGADMRAYEEAAKNHRGAEYIVFGHTHEPVRKAMAVRKNGTEVLYVNTGSWRNRIVKTEGDEDNQGYIELKQMAYAVFYQDKDKDGKDINRMEMWDGIRREIKN